MANKLLKDWRIIICLIAYLIAAFFIFSKGLQFGLDFKGGTLLDVELEGTPTPEQVQMSKQIIENRLNFFALKDISVRSWGSNYLMVEVAGATQDEIDKVKRIISEEGRFEAFVGGEKVLGGDDLMIDPQRPATVFAEDDKRTAYRYTVYFSIKSDASKKFAEIAYGKVNYPVKMYLERPAYPVLITSKYLSGSDVSYNKDENKVTYAFGMDVPLSLDAQVLPIEEDNVSADVISELKAMNSTRVILAGNFTDAAENALLASGFEIQRRERPKAYETAKDFVFRAVNLITWPSLSEGVTQGDPVEAAYITGASKDKDEAVLESKRIESVLRSGKLPVNAKVGGEMSISPVLGQQFLSYALYIGIMVSIAVAFVLFIRYRRLKIVLPVTATSLSEVFLTLGFASMVGWNLDLASIGGLLAAVGTGVDDQIVIIDEALGGKEDEAKKEIGGLVEKFKRAFFIVWTAFFTITAAMVPLGVIGGGTLAGFAFTTIAGLSMGVFITRPAFSVVVKSVLE